MNDLFSKRLKVLRTSVKMTQGELAKKIGVGRTTITEYEKGGIAPSHERLLALSRVFNVSMDYLTGTDKNSVDELSEADKADISSQINDIMNNLDSWGNLTFEGETLDDATRALLHQSLENAYQIGKLISNRRKGN